MQATSDWTWKHAYVLEDDDIKKLWKLLDERLGNVEAELRCLHDTNLKATEAKHVLGYENPAERRVLSMLMTARSDDFDSSARLDFRAGNWWSRGINVTITGRADVVQQLNESLRLAFSGTRPWFWWLARVEYIGLFFNAWAVAWLLLMVLLWAGVLGGSSQPQQPQSQSGRVDPLTWGVFMCCVVAGCGWILNRFNRWAFPSSTYCIGQGKKRHENMDKARWGVFFAFVVGVVASVVASVIVAWLF